MATAVLENGLAALAFARRVTLGLLEDVPKDRLFHQLTSGGNHAAWVIGHLAVTDDTLLSGLGGRAPKCPKSWEKLFGMGSQPTGNPSDYPPVAEITERLSQCREELAAWFGSMDEAKLASPLPKDMETFAASHGALMSSLAVHEGLHAGQLTMIRRDLGIGPKFA
jgi:hypothetical protein